jgi:hypothetical protein
MMVTACSFWSLCRTSSSVPCATSLPFEMIPTVLETCGPPRGCGSRRRSSCPGRTDP